MPKTTTYRNVAGLNKALRSLPKEASAELRKASKVIAADIATEAQGRARAQGGLAAIIAPTIRASTDRVPAVKMGSTASLPTSGNGWTHPRTGARQTIGDVIWGGEFGGGARDTTQQFLPHRGRLGYFLWPTVRDRSDDIDARYSEALDAALQDLR